MLNPYKTGDLVTVDANIYPQYFFEANKPYTVVSAEAQWLMIKSPAGVALAFLVTDVKPYVEPTRVEMSAAEYIAKIDETVPADEPEYTGGSVSYYSVKVDKPTTDGATPYTAECNDIIEALGMNYAEGNAFKALWRMCAARKGKAKKGYTDGRYDAEKVVFFGQRLVAQAE